MELTCIIIDDEPYTIAELKDELNKQAGIRLLRSFSGVAASLAFLERQRVDIIFCDINLPGLNGIQAAKLLRPYCDFLIYVTGHAEYALEAFGVHAQGYLLKPIIGTEIKEKLAEINRLRNQVGEQQHEEEPLYLKGDHKWDVVKILPSDILYVEAKSNYISIHTESDIRTFYMSMRDINGILSPFGRFIRISRSIIINADYMQKCENNMVIMEDCQSFKIGGTYKNTFLDFMRKRMPIN